MITLYGVRYRVVCLGSGRYQPERENGENWEPLPGVLPARSEASALDAVRGYVRATTASKSGPAALGRRFR